MGPEEEKKERFYARTGDGYGFELVGEIRELPLAEDQRFEKVEFDIGKLQEVSVTMTLTDRKMKKLMKLLRIRKKDFADIRRRESWKRQRMRKIKKKSAARS